MRKVAIALALAAASSTASGAVRSTEISEVDRAGIDAAVDGVYAVISGPIGAKRDWAKMRSMFTEDARLFSITPNGLRGGSLDRYIEINGPLLEQHGFVERELARRVEVYGNLAHAWSSYEGIGDSGELKVRGINSFQLARQSDGRWKIFTVLWQPENSSIPLPADMNEGSSK